MSHIHICWSRSYGVNEIGQTLPLASSAVHAADVIVSQTGVSTQSAPLAIAAGTSPRQYVCTIKNGGDTAAPANLPVYVIVAPNPVALASGAGMRHLLMPGDVFECHAENNGDRVAVINADITA